MTTSAFTNPFLSSLERRRRPENIIALLNLFSVRETSHFNFRCEVFDIRDQGPSIGTTPFFVVGMIYSLFYRHNSSCTVFWVSSFHFSVNIVLVLSSVSLWFSSSQSFVRPQFGSAVNHGAAMPLRPTLLTHKNPQRCLLDAKICQSISPQMF